MDLAALAETLWLFSALGKTELGDLFVPVEELAFSILCVCFASVLEVPGGGS
jgi:hypothetical protein